MLLVSEGVCFGGLDLAECLGGTPLLLKKNFEVHYGLSSSIGTKNCSGEAIYSLFLEV